ncbi:unnamed protein product [Soboliphyme baturini]|uniref:RanBD1 domain-containing protein n=1 Tax=Soboliphyme baturini TaxID=241478 RepID=A0A183IIY1_9BILA|nr:unnamed protein product [Soboliphyme baturini]
MRYNIHVVPALISAFVVILSDQGCAVEGASHSKSLKARVRVPVGSLVGTDYTLCQLFSKYRPSTDSVKSETSTENTVIDGETDASTYEPNVEFEPVIPLPQLVEVKTGEEDETCRAKLYRFCSEPAEFKERGIGDLKILKHPVTGKVRVVMRREQVFKLCANHYLSSDMKLVPMSKKPNAFTWVCNDFSEGVIQRELFAAKFKAEKDAEAFKKCFEECAASLGENATLSNVKRVEKVADKTDHSSVAPASCNLMDKFKPNPGSWTCSTCLVSNDANAVACCCCGNVKTGAPKTTESKQEHAVSATTTDATPKSCLFSFSSQNTAQASRFSFGFAKETSGETAKPKGQSTSHPDSTTKADFSFGNTLGPAKSATGPLSFSFGTPRSNAEENSSKEKDTSHGKTDEPDKEDSAECSGNTDAYFEPVVSLPEVVVKTGEEHEVEAFKMPAKLFRFVEKEWKERCVGELRLLKHNDTGNVRVVMRQDQSLKVCLNHYLPPSVPLAHRNDRSWMWGANDFSDGITKEELFCAKFRTKAEADLFQSEWDKLCKGLPPISKTADLLSTIKNEQKSTASNTGSKLNDRN